MLGCLLPDNTVYCGGIQKERKKGGKEDVGRVTSGGEKITDDLVTSY